VSRATRLSKTWCRVHQSSNVILTVTQAAIMSCDVLEGALIAPTVLRSRGDYLIVAAPNAGSDIEVVGLGICIVNQSALDVGGLSLPGPIADQNSDVWLWHQFVPLDAAGATTVDPLSLTAIKRGVIDSKAMRRLAPDQAVVFMAELETGAMATVDILAGIAFLFGT